MCAANPVCILWDASHIWGLMVWRALCALGLPCRLVKGQDIANGALFRKPCPQGTPGKERGAAPLLLVPGGNARLKARALGEKGRQAVRDYLAEGGRYLGFCGGAGLALGALRGDVAVQLADRDGVASLDVDRRGDLLADEDLSEVLGPRPVHEPGGVHGLHGRQVCAAGDVGLIVDGDSLVVEGCGSNESAGGN